MITPALGTENRVNRTFANNVIAKNNSRTVGVFLHHRDAKVALQDLQDAGFPLKWITLISQNCWQYSWLKGLRTCDRFNKHFFNSSDKSWQFFQRLFQRGKYLIAIEAPSNSLRCAEAILSRRRGHGEVWHL
ncbi:hypothetical protein [Myxosarcina sp. GI1]|uniref:hypothetical protein n=1 Tax=Myxosarcina sp. GI1 TaxID=1541065 RepID=UPI00068DBA56|nr:hypothetical protein [Myxosarcina sp. GI1]